MARVSTDWARPATNSSSWVTGVIGNITTISAGTPMGLLLSLTYANAVTAANLSTSTSWSRPSLVSTNWAAQ